MRLIKMDDRTAVLGIQGEANVAQLRFDVKCFMHEIPNGVPVLNIHNPDGLTYPAIIDYSPFDKCVYHILTAADTQHAGVLKFELQWLLDDKIAKSLTYTGRIISSMGETAESPEYPIVSKEIIEHQKSMDAQAIAELQPIVCDALVLD